MSKIEAINKAYEYAQEVLSDIGVIKALADIHLLGLSHDPCETSELRGCVIGAYRTVALGGALASRFIQASGGTKEDISRAYWTFVNESSIRAIAVDISMLLLLGDVPPVGVIRAEFEFLFSKGYEIGNLYSQGKFPEAFEVWRETMKADANEAARDNSVPK